MDFAGSLLIEILTYRPVVVTIVPRNQARRRSHGFFRRDLGYRRRLVRGVETGRPRRGEVCAIAY
jgi:hypothetical protein